MSAYIVEKHHIQYILAAIQSPVICRHDFTYTRADGEHVRIAKGDFAATAAIGNILWQENARSVNYRYKEAYPADKLTARDISLSFDIQPLQLLRALDCLEYQSCETPDFADSEAFIIIKRLIKYAYQAIPGYSTSIWGAPAKKTAKSVTPQPAAVPYQAPPVPAAKSAAIQPQILIVLVKNQPDSIHDFVAGRGLQAN